MMANKGSTRPECRIINLLKSLFPPQGEFILRALNVKSHSWLLAGFVALVMLSRWPGLFPPSFSVVYGLAFCGGVYFSGAMAWWLPLGTVAVTDVALNFYYQAKGFDVWTWSVIKYQLVNYLVYAGIIGLGRGYKPQSKFFALLGGGVLGALVFFLVTNTASWLLNPFHNPEYTHTLSGWLVAIIKGTNGWPQTWEFFRNTLFSGGLFTGLFVAAMKLSAAESPADKEAGVRANDAETEPEAEEASA